ncbi:hypothetical protein ALP72_03997 [Pseudomonas coronafaciens pv. coronafaciens]|uniref:integrase n=1 Tax=Pseudomonas coronafaciens TaxID=53409 RepID=UPI000EFE13C7|nr:integrase [Pseudomonas coronafaciens]RMS13731.1 hypothetical protein ALP72_03997 [Pseudomonas coronafaciens pv. coronafaciens]
MSGGLQAINALFTGAQFSVASEPDKASQVFGAPSSDFVLCRTESGSPTAIYSGRVWDFNPYRLSAKKITRILFYKVFDNVENGQESLVEEVKYILYCIIYYAGGGRVGALSASTLCQYWNVLRLAMRFCYEQKDKKMVGVLSLKQLLSVPVYLSAFIGTATFRHSVLAGILQKLAIVGQERLGYSVVNRKMFDLKPIVYKQHPVIPTRIYLDLINLVGDMLDQIYEGEKKLESFIECFSDANYGVVDSVQRSRGVGGKAHHQPDIASAIADHGLIEVFSGEFSCPRKVGLQRVLLLMQYVAKTVIHIYTGMRDQEVMRMSYLCLAERNFSDALVDDTGFECDPLEPVNIVSTTTKFTGYRKESIWFAPGEVVKAIKIAQAICRGLAKLYNIQPDEKCPLFLNPSVLGQRRKNAEVGVTNFSGDKTQGSALRNIIIGADDLKELAQTDPSRDFHNEPDYAVGQCWPLTSHQFRRSLAFYGSSSGFVSLPTVRTQFKHATIEMARYYSNNHDKLRTIFGFYDEKINDFILPANHFAFEFQMSIPMSVANQLIADLLFSEEPLFGGTGSYMEKQKRNIDVGEINIQDVRTDTERRVRNGVISYRPTLLGGCTKVGRCDAFLLGDFVQCLSCAGAILKPQNVRQVIDELLAELDSYDERSGEHQVVKLDVEQLINFQNRIIKVAEDEGES